jgi:hypothetical protein
MKCLWAAAIGLSLVCGLASLMAEEPQWRPAKPSAPLVGVTLGRPIVSATDSDAPIQAPPSSGIALASYLGPEPLAVVRGQIADEGSSFAVDSHPNSLAPPSGPATSAGPIHTFMAMPAGPSQTPIAPVPALPGKPVTSTAAAPGSCGKADCCDTTCCDSSCCNTICCDPCCPQRGRLYGSFEYLLWWISPASAPPLLTTGPASQPSNGQIGALGFPGNAPIFGGPLDYGTFSGGRLTFGYWFDPCETWAVEGRFFFLGQNNLQFSAGSPGLPVVARPFFNLNQNVSAAELTAAPGIAAGEAIANSASQLWGAELNLRKNCCCWCWGRWDVFGGFRFLDLTESLTVNENVIALANSMSFSNIAPGSMVFDFDSFRTENQFYGGQLGTELELRAGKWFTDLRGAVAVGDMHQIVEINGAEAVFPPNGGVQFSQGGLLALPSNIGRFTRERFAVVPELGINVGYAFTENCRVFVGYTALYASNVVRPGDQIDTTLNVSQIPHIGQPPPPNAQVRPLLPFKSTDLWAHGVNFGLELRY